MPIELLVLSGSRQGERIELDSEKITIGDQVDCSLQFGAKTDPAARGRCLELYHETDGWRIRSLGQGLSFLNADPLSQDMALRSGDMVRLSASGPDVRFSILRQASAGGQKSGPAASSAATSTSRENAEPIASVEPPTAKPTARYSTSPPPESSLDDFIEAKVQRVAAKPKSEQPTVGVIPKQVLVAGGILAVLATCFLALAVPIGFGLIAISGFWDESVAEENVVPFEILIPEDYALNSIPALEEGKLFQASVKLDAPPEWGNLTYSVKDAPDGLRIDPVSGEMTWTPSEEDGPGEYDLFLHILSDAPIDDKRYPFTLKVKESPQPPVWQRVPDQEVLAGKELRLTVSAEDADLPKQAINYSIVGEKPEGMLLDSNTGLLSWLTSSEDAGKKWTILLKATDSGTPPQSAQQYVDLSVVAEESSMTPKAVAGKNPAVWLIAVDSPEGKGLWSLATACAIEEHTFLTSATVAVQVQTFQEQGWVPYAVRQDLQKKVPITEPLVHKAFEILADRPTEQLYFDLGLLMTEDTLSETLQLATAEELGTLELGSPLDALVIPHDADRLTRFDLLQPEPFLVQLYQATASSAEEIPDEARPVLLHLKGEVPPNAYGGAIVNEAGHLVSIYAERSGAEPDADDNRIHYGPTLETIAFWLQQNNREIWVTPTAAPSE
ncbi:Hypothetical protein PBC10988_21510 [Planctomycetales bacterium 10988]|nr:Hypothetical protein PBC10988_21510 [Planctomycetales bacterium 10988]